MGKPPTIGSPPAEILTILSVSPIEQDHSCLQGIIGPSRWRLLPANVLSTARTLLQAHDVSVVLCESNLQTGTWIDVLNYIQPMLDPPSLIVTSTLVDERLWAEALNLGAWDVLAKPFDPLEVIRSLKLASDHWYYQIRGAVKPLTMAAS